MTSNPYRNRRRLRRVMVSSALLSGVALHQEERRPASSRPSAPGSATRTGPSLRPDHSTPPDAPELPVAA